jgi:hypothetical protein
MVWRFLVPNTDNKGEQHEKTIINNINCICFVLACLMNFPVSRHSKPTFLAFLFSALAAEIALLHAPESLQSKK